MRLFNIQHMCTGDGPGIRTTVFFQGCPLRCIWCHNPEGKSSHPILGYYSHLCIHCRKCESVCRQGVHLSENGKRVLQRQRCIHCGDCAECCPTGALELLGRDWSLEEVLREINLDRVFYGNEGGVTLSGGEPFAQPTALWTLLPTLKQEGINICMETCGFTSPENIARACRMVDTFLFDYKETDPALHKQFTGVDPEPILKNLDVLDAEGATVLLRCPIIPDCNLREEHFLGIAALAKRHRCIKSVELMPYHPLGIGKSRQIGSESDYANPAFLKRELLFEAARQIGDVCGKAVRVH